MSEQYQTQPQPQWGAPSAQPKPKKARRWPWIAALPVAFFTGMVAMAAGETPTTTPVAAEPAPTVTVQAEGKPAPAKTVEVPGPTKTETVTRTRTVTKVPQICRDALDYADKGFGYASEAMDAASRGFFAAAEFDVDGILAAQDDIEAATGKINALAPDYQVAKAACRAAK